MPRQIAGHTWLTIEEVAAELHVTPRTVNNYIRKRVIVASKIGGRWLMTEQAVKDHIDQKSNIRGETIGKHPSIAA